jgi:hypothetical protein
VGGKELVLWCGAAGIARGEVEEVFVEYFDARETGCGCCCKF